MGTLIWVIIAVIVGAGIMYALMMYFLATAYLG